MLKVNISHLHLLYIISYTDIKQINFTHEHLHHTNRITCVCVFVYTHVTDEKSSVLVYSIIDPVLSLFKQTRREYWDPCSWPNSVFSSLEVRLPLLIVVLPWLMKLEIVHMREYNTSGNKRDGKVVGVGGTMVYHLTSLKYSLAHRIRTPQQRCWPVFEYN